MRSRVKTWIERGFGSIGNKSYGLNQSQCGHLEVDGIEVGVRLTPGTPGGSCNSHEIDNELHLACFIVQGGLGILNGPLCFARCA